MNQKIFPEKKIKLNHIIILLALICFSVVSACKSSDNKKGTSSNDQGPTFNYSHPLSFLSGKDSVITKVKVAIADTPEKRDAGLMNVRDLPEYDGMLFIFKKPQPLSFWMANTPLPLDIIFIDKDYKIVRIYHSTTPYSKNELSSGSPAQYVVELNGGFCINHDVTEGMKVKF